MTCLCLFVDDPTTNARALTKDDIDHYEVSESGVTWAHYIPCPVHGHTAIAAVEYNEPATAGTAPVQ